MLFSVRGFRGVRPKLDPRSMTPADAVVANNCKLWHGNLQPWHGPVEKVSLLKDDVIKTIYRAFKTPGDDDSGVWFHWNTVVDVAPSAVRDDANQRMYWTGDGYPKMTDATIGQAGPDYPTNHYRMGLPQPEAGMLAELVTTAQVRVYYKFTYVEKVGATLYEGDDSVAVITCEHQPGQMVKVRNIPNYAGAEDIKYVRIYRANETSVGSGTPGTFKLVGEVANNVRSFDDEVYDVDLGVDLPAPAAEVTAIPNATTAATYVEADTDFNPEDTEIRNYVVVFVSAWSSVTAESIPSAPTVNFEWKPGDYVELTNIPNAPAGNYNITSKKIYRLAFDGESTEYMLVDEIGAAVTEYTDTKLSKDLGEVIPSADFYPPDDDMHSLMLLPGGVMIGVVDRSVAVGKQFIHHAFSPLEEVAIGYPVVAIGNLGGSIVALTQQNPHVINGSSPGNMSAEELPIGQGCVSKRATVSTPSGVIYPSTDGLVVIGPGGAHQLVTLPWFGRDDWLKLKPATIHAAFHDQRYIGFYDDGTNQKGFILDPSQPEIGLTYLDFWVSAMYADPLADHLFYCKDDAGTNKIYQFDADEDNPLTYKWRSSTYKASMPATFQAGCVVADSYEDLTMRLYYKGSDNAWALWHQQVVANGNPFRMPGGAAWSEWQIELEGTDTVYEVTVAETISELQEE